MDIHTYLKHLIPQDKDLSGRNYSILFPGKIPPNFPNKNHLTLKIDLNKYFRKSQIKIPKEVKKLSKNMIKAQDKLYQRAAEELLEFCNEEIISNQIKMRDNFNIHPELRGRPYLQINLDKELENVIPFTEMANTDGTKVNRISEIKNNIVILLLPGEEILLNEKVKKFSHKNASSINDISGNNFKGILKMATNNWY